MTSSSRVLTVKRRQTNQQKADKHQNQLDFPQSIFSLRCISFEVERRAEWQHDGRVWKIATHRGSSTYFCNFKELAVLRFLLNFQSFTHSFRSFHLLLCVVIHSQWGTPLLDVATQYLVICLIRFCHSQFLERIPSACFLYDVTAPPSCFAAQNEAASFHHRLLKESGRLFATQKANYKAKEKRLVSSANRNWVLFSSTNEPITKRQRCSSRNAVVLLPMRKWRHKSERRVDVFVFDRYWLRDVTAVSFWTSCCSLESSSLST